MTLKKISGPWNLLQASDVAELKRQILALRRKGIHVETRKATKFKIGVDLYREVEGMTTALDFRREEIKSTPGNAVVSMLGGKHR